MDTSVHQMVPEVRVKDFPVHPMGPLLGGSTEEIEVDEGRLEVPLLDQQLRNFIEVWNSSLIHRRFQHRNRPIPIFCGESKIY